MFSELKKLTKQSVIYGIGQVASPLLGFILLPMYTRFLNPGEYGVYQLTAVAGLFLTAIIGLGVNSGLVRIYFIYDTKEEQNRVASTCIIFSAVTTCIAAFAVWLISPYVAGYLFEVPNANTLLRLLIANLMFQIVGNNLLGILRAEEKATVYTTFTFFTVGFSLLLNILFVAVLNRKVQGLLEAQLISNIVNIFVLYPLAMKGKKLDYSGKIIKEVLAFGAPLIPALIADLVLNMADRYFLNYYVSAAEVGLYSLGYRLASMVSEVIAKPFKVAWPPYMFRVAKQKNAKDIYKIVLVYFVYLSFWFGLAIALLSKELIIILTTPEFYEAYLIVPIVVTSYILFGMVSILIAGIHIKKKTKYGSIFTIISAVVNTICNYLLIPKFGMMGAAVSTIISYIVLNAGIFYYSQKLYPINHEFGRMIKIFVCAAILYGIGTLTVYTGNLIVTIILKSFLVIMFPISLYVLKFYKKEEIYQITTYYNNKIKPFFNKYL